MLKHYARVCTTKKRLQIKELNKCQDKEFLLENGVAIQLYTRKCGAFYFKPNKDISFIMLIIMNISAKFSIDSLWFVWYVITLQEVLEEHSISISDTVCIVSYIQNAEVSGQFFVNSECDYFYNWSFCVEFRREHHRSLETIVIMSSLLSNH